MVAGQNGPITKPAAVLVELGVNLGVEVVRTLHQSTMERNVQARHPNP